MSSMVDFSLTIAPGPISFPLDQYHGASYHRLFRLFFSFYLQWLSRPCFYISMYDSERKIGLVNGYEGKAVAEPSPSSSPPGLSPNLSPTRSSGSSSHHPDGLGHDDNGSEQDEIGGREPRELEATVSRVSSGPAYTVFSRHMIWWIVAMNFWSAFMSPMTANIYFPAMPAMATDLGISTNKINLSLTTYMVFQGLAPTIFGDLGDVAGRRPAFIIAFTIYLGANIGLALQRNFAALLVLRALQSGGSSGTIALVYAVVADIAPSSERGKWMGIVGGGITIGPALGPTIGGLLTQYLGWASIFWFLTIVTALWMVPYILAVPETGRQVVGNGSTPPQGWNTTLLDYIRFRNQSQNRSVARPKQKFPIPNPLKTLAVLMNKGMAVVLLYNAMLYIGFMIVTATMSSQFKDIYHYNDLQLGLCYLPMGIACMISSVTQGFILDWNYRRIAKKIGFKIDRKRGDNLEGFPIERVRIQLIYPLVAVGTVAYIGFGWALDQEVHVAIPLAMTLFIGLTITGSFQVLNTLIVDLYPHAPATATAANNLVRCLFGAVATTVIEDIIQAIGRGWAYTLIALFFAVFSPSLWVIQRHGPKWREDSRLKMIREAEKKETRDREKAEPPAWKGQGREGVF
ncbi:major facilitator superfamily domain-containing protein [Pseudomassariella vexata]|uniref:Major facilitator superfamily domain-containing protein n=1 Tax=Pseudomassariella vexata TaxID=1141098 RepID=A0A1Y2DKR3_9PEZI|nr:major facilitator superfamily domain-containing protein [Pseudomassariella vexata]ORY59744.1 major facilitator superfamily domain-containing protein [Pseudomassariella vexata]